MITVINETNFENEVQNYKGKILLDFWASWCGPCKMMAPVFDELSEISENIKFGKVNIDECSELAARFNVMSIPTFILFENGSVIKEIKGAIPKQELIEFFNIQIQPKA